MWNLADKGYLGDEFRCGGRYPLIAQLRRGYGNPFVRYQLNGKHAEDLRHQKWHIDENGKVMASLTWIRAKR
jgi:hypothetical protein